MVLNSTCVPAGPRDWIFQDDHPRSPRAPVAGPHCNSCRPHSNAARSGRRHPTAVPASHRAVWRLGRSTSAYRPSARSAGLQLWRRTRPPCTRCYWDTKSPQAPSRRLSRGWYGLFGPVRPAGRACGDRHQCDQRCHQCHGQAAARPEAGPNGAQNCADHVHPRLWMQVRCDEQDHRIRDARTRGKGPFAEVSCQPLPWQRGRHPPVAPSTRPSRGPIPQVLFPRGTKRPFG